MNQVSTGSIGQGGRVFASGLGDLSSIPKDFKNGT